MTRVYLTIEQALSAHHYAWKSSECLFLWRSSEYLFLWRWKSSVL
jgi:hypothetical protein